MCSSACERAGSAQIAVSTVVAALAQSKLAAWAPHAGTARQAARRRAARMARSWRVRGGAATDSTGMAERMCRLPTPGKPALHIRLSTIARGGHLPKTVSAPAASCDGRGYELIASETQSTFCRRLLHGYRQAVGGGRHRAAGTGADRDQVVAAARNGADPGLGVVVRPGVGQRLAGDQRAAVGGAGDGGVGIVRPERRWPPPRRWRRSSSAPPW